MVRASGISKHTAFPQGGANAVYLLTEWLTEAGLCNGKEFELFNRINRDFAGTGLNINCKDGDSGELTCVGSRMFMKDKRTGLGLNIRYPVTADSAKIIQQIHKICGEYGCEFKPERDSRPNNFPKEHPAVTRLTEIYREVTGIPAKPYVMGGGTYARKLPNAFAFGPGMPDNPPQGLFKPRHGGAHEPDEAQNTDNLLKALKIYCRAVLSISGIRL